MNFCFATEESVVYLLVFGTIIFLFIGTQFLGKNSWKSIDNPNIALNNLYRAKLLGVAFGLGTGLVAAIGIAGLLGYSPFEIIFGSIFIGVIFGRIPIFVCKMHERKRRSKFESGLTELVTGVVVAMRAGVSFNRALGWVSQDLGGIVGEEFKRVLQENELGISIDQGLERLGNRIGGEDIKLLVTAVKLSGETGSSLANVLGKMTKTMRDRQEYKDKLQTMTMEGRFQALAIASMPFIIFLILYVVSPDLMSILLTTRMGWTAIAVVIFLEYTGWVWIKKLVSIEV